jgi:DNA adenine methylase
MQLALSPSFASHVPPKGQLLKWVGNKQRFAAEICKFFPDEVKTYYEPFLGSGAVMATYRPEKGVGSDVFSPLIEIWNELKNNPETLKSWYRDRRDRIISEDKKTVYASILSSFNKCHNGPDFLFLTRSCYGGIIRFRKSDGHMSTPCGPHNPISSSSFNKRVDHWHTRMKDYTFQHSDFEDTFSKAKRGDLIYCDPPYVDSQGILYGAQAFKLSRLMDAIAKAKSRGVNVALSIDGTKKSGNHLCNVEIPDGMFETEVSIKVGKSMLRRFQIEGKTANDEEVTDKLLLTYSK